MKEDLTDAMLAGMEAGAGIFSNPMMKLQALSQAASNLANVAEVAHKIGYDLDAQASSAATGPREVFERKATDYLRLRDIALQHAIALMQQIKNEPP